MNRYGGYLEVWKQALIVERARRKGIKDTDLEDLQQIIVPKIFKFKFDPEKSKGCSEVLALKSLIDKELIMFFRTRSRAVQRLNKLCSLKVIPTKQDYVEAKQNNETYASTLKFDVQAVLNALTEDERKVCRMLSEEYSYEDIAEELDTTKYNIQETIDYIRQRFLDAGFSPEWFTL